MKHWIKCEALSFLQNTSGTVAFEYILIVGGVSVVVAIGLGVAPGLGGLLIPAICLALDTVVGPPGTISC